MDDYSTRNVPAAEYDFTLDKGANFDYTLTWYRANGSLVNLTGYTARMMMRQGVPTNPTLALELSTANGRIVLGGVLGTIELLAPATITVDLEPVLHSYDLFLTDSFGVPVAIIRGHIDVVENVTR